MNMEKYNLSKRAENSVTDWLSYELPSLKTLATWDDCEEYLGKLDDLDISDFAHMESDSWDWVIYTHHAWNLVNANRGSALDQAEESMADCGFDFESIDGTITKLAYWLCYHALDEEAQSQIEALREMVAAIQDGKES